MTDFLLELLSEEIPARMQDGARAELARLFEAEMGKPGLKAEAIQTYATPRRLTLIARGLPHASEPVSEEVKGPRATAPPQALEGFLRKTGLTRDRLVERDGVLFAVLDKPGRATIDVLAYAIPAIVRGFAWPKSMRWGAASASTESPRWVRPLHGIVALFGSDIVTCEIDGIAAGAETVGHRFHHPGRITIGNADDYAAKLKACHVVVDQDERKAIIRDAARALAADAGLALIEDEGLVAENAGLTEWPVPLLGAFDPANLDVPGEVITLTMRTNQKYFALRVPTASLRSAPPPEGEDQPNPPPRGEVAARRADGGGLAPNFIAVANLAASDGGARIAEGNAKVIAARLADAHFFWEQDRKLSLEDHAQKLKDIVFHEKLGTVADKVERVAKLARWLVEEGIVKSSPERGGGPPQVVEGHRKSSHPAAVPLHQPAAGPPPPAGEDLATLAETAARLCKADLVTAMVGEFPELQGIMGGHYARAEGLDPQIADAIRDHYKPVGQGDEVPTAPVTVAVSLADKLDTLFSFFAVDERPTGSKDPFALRRAALGVLAMQIGSHLRYDVEAAYVNWARLADYEWLSVAGGLEQLRYFFADRLKVQQREAGIRQDLIDAVFALGGEDDLVRLLARVKALQAFVETEDGTNLLAGYKRAANILKKEGHSPLPLAGGATREASGGGLDSRDVENLLQITDPVKKTLSYTPLDEEHSLIAALDSAEPRAAAAIEHEDFEGAMRALATLRAPIDAFFDKVTVNDSDPMKRTARLALLARVRAAVHRVADFSRIEG